MQSLRKAAQDGCRFRKFEVKDFVWNAPCGLWDCCIETDRAVTPFSLGCMAWKWPGGGRTKAVESIGGR